MSSNILDVKDLRVRFYNSDGVTYAVNGVSLTLEKGETLAIVGESGCGKSVTSLSFLQLLNSKTGKIEPGSSIKLNGEELVGLPLGKLRKIRGNKIAMIFQDPMTSLNPVMRVGEQMTEGLRLHRGISAREAAQAAEDMLARVGIVNPAERARDFPHQMSGGMRQRVMIGMALACSPALLVADEPTTALDVTVQKQILALMRSLVGSFGSGLLLITHDLGLVAQVADRVAVMYAGRIVEEGTSDDVLLRPSHPYTRGLLRSRPGTGKRKKRLEAIPGTVPGLWSRPFGCAFQPRCAEAFERCSLEMPPLIASKDNAGRHRGRCWLLDDGL